MAPFEGIDVGHRPPLARVVGDLRGHGPFPFTGTLHQVRYEPGEPAPDSAWRWKDMLREMGAKFE